MTTAAHAQDIALRGIDTAVTGLLNAQAEVGAAFDRARANGIPDEEIQGAFERAGLDFAGVPGAVEAGRS